MAQINKTAQHESPKRYLIASFKNFKDRYCQFLSVRDVLFLLAYYNAFKQLLQLNGLANQLLAAFTMLAVSLWLMQKGKNSLCDDTGYLHASDHHRIAFCRAV